MSMTPVPSSIRLVRAAIADSSGNGEASCRAKWCTRTYAPSTPSSSAATASSTLCTSASRPVRTCEPGMGCQCPKERKPIRFASLMGSRAPTAVRVFPGATKARRPSPWGASPGLSGRTGSGGLDRDRRDADEQVGGQGVGGERLVEQAGGLLGELDPGAVQDRRAVGVHGDRLEVPAVEVEQRGARGGQLTVDGDVTEEAGRLARV